MPKLLYLSESELNNLTTNIAENVSRYRTDGFEDLRQAPGWAIDLDIEIDPLPLKRMDGSNNRSETDLKNTLLVLEALGELSPSLANEERIWVRLSHIEGFEYSKGRWLDTTQSDEQICKSVRKHFFASTQTGIRDDHSLSRLWWNGYIAKHCYPQDVGKALKLLLTRADVRSNMVERIWLTGRRKLASGVFRIMENDDRVLATEQSFREFMKALNLMGGGIVFESMTDSEIDTFLNSCVDRASV